MAAAITTTTSTIFLSIATPPQIPQSQHHFYGSNRVSISQIAVTKSLFKPISMPLRCSSPNSTSVSVVVPEEEEEETSPPSDDFSLQSESTPPSQDSDPIYLLSGCKSCGREEIEKGCNGEGRIQGGIATVPGFGWWPIKAYKPCPGFVASGGRYKRRGQTMDEVASGRGERVVSLSIDQEPQSRKKKAGLRKFKK